MLKKINNIWFFPIMSAVLLLLPLILARNDYQDDMYRTTSGYTDFWFENGRPLSVWVYRLLNQGYVTPDTSPLNFIVAFIFILMAGFFLSNKLADKNDTLIQTCLPVLFISSPFLTSILSYKYDCLPVAIALFLATILPFLEIKNSLIKFLSRLIIVFMVFCLYQPVLSLIFGVAGLKILKLDNASSIKAKVKDVVSLVVCILVAFVLYKISISDRMLNDYYKAHGALIHVDASMVTKLFSNIMSYFHNLKLFLKHPYILLPLTGAILLVGSYLFKTKWEQKILFLLSLPFIFVSMVGCNIVLEQPAFQAREMLGVPCLFMFLLILLSGNRLNRIYRICTIALTLGVFLTNVTISYAYLNYKDELARRDQLILSDINQSIIHYGTKNINDIKLTYIVDKPTNKQSAMERAYPIINILIQYKEFSSAWYASAILNAESNINIPVTQGEVDFNDPQFTTCFTKSKLEDHVMYLSVVRSCI